MKFWKRFLSIFLCIALLISVFSACSSLNLKSSDQYLTKSEWFEMLGKTFGFGEKSEVSSDEYIDLCKKWDIISEDENIDKKEKTDREYALATAVYALGNKVTGLDRETTKIIDAAKYAVNNNIGKSNSWIYMHEGVTEDEALEILEEASRVYNQRKFEVYDRTKYNKNLKYQKDTKDYRIDSVEDKIIVDSEKNNYSKGDVVVFGEGVNAKSLKIVGTKSSGEKTILLTEPAEISEICESIDVSGYGTVQNASDIKTAEGVTLIGFNGQKLTNSFETPAVEQLGRSEGLATIGVGKHTSKDEYKTSDIEFKVELSSGSIKASASKGNFKGSAKNKFNKKDDKGNEILDENGKPIPRDKIEEWSSEGKKYSGGFKISGSVKLDDLLVSASLKYNTVDVFGFDTNAVNLFDPADSFDVNIDTKITNSISVEGYLKEEIELGEIPIPAGPITINLKAKLYSDVNGKVQVKIVFYNSTSITWSSSQGFKKTVTKDTEKDFSIEVKMDAGVKIEIGIGIFDVSVIDVDIKIGFEFKIKFEVNELVRGEEGLFKCGGDAELLTNPQTVYLLCFDATITLPVIKIGINTGDSLLAKLNRRLSNVELSVEWEIVGGDKAAVKGAELPIHYELNNGFVKKCLKDSLKPYDKDGDDEDETEEDNDSKGESTTDYINALQVDSYAIDLSIGESKNLGLVSIPDDCTITDIAVSSSDTSIATVGNIESGGEADFVTITGISEGTTTITVSCDRTGESISCVIIVTE